MRVFPVVRFICVLVGFVGFLYMAYTCELTDLSTFERLEFALLITLGGFGLLALEHWPRGNKR